MEYKEGSLACISIESLAKSNVKMQYTSINPSNDGDETTYMLYNEFGELCCLEGEECLIDHRVAGTKDVYDLRNDNGETTVHFMLTKDEMDVAIYYIF